MKKILLILTCLLILPLQVLAAKNTNMPVTPNDLRPSVKIYNPVSQILEKEFYPFDETSTVQGVNVAVGDVNGDGLNEIVVAAGRNEKPIIKIFNNKLELLNEFQAYADKFTKGFNLTVAHLYNAQAAVIITAPNEGGGPHIRIFNDQGILITDFFAFDPNIYSGVNVTAGDINKDGKMEIIAGAGAQSEPKVKIFDNSGQFIREFMAYDKKVKSGVSVLAFDANADGQADIITAPYMDAAAEVKVFNPEGVIINKFEAYPKNFIGGINLSSGDIDNDKTAEIFTSPGFGMEDQIKFFAPDGKVKINTGFIIFPGFKGGTSITGADLDNDGQTELIAGMQTISPINKYDAYKYIEIDISKQYLYSYYKGELRNKFIISTGKNGYPTPPGKYKVLTKVPSTTMSGYYGPNDPNNYNLPNVPSVMYFYKGFAIHGAYWHWKFGTRVSHGCVNLKLPDAKNLYNWAIVGTVVNVYSTIK